MGAINGGKATMNTNQKIFRDMLVEQYTQLFKEDPDYAYSASRSTPEALADRMTESLTKGNANKDGVAIRNVCRKLKIAHTYRAIQGFLENGGYNDFSGF